MQDFIRSSFLDRLAIYGPSAQTVHPTTPESKNSSMATRKRMKPAEEVTGVPTKRCKIVEGATHASSYYDTLGVEMVDIFVGQNKQLFRLHQKLLCTKVQYFNIMFSNDFKEAHNKEAILKEEDVDTFNLFVEWLYMGHLRPVDITKHTAESGPLLNRIKLYCFADKYCISDLMDYAITSCISNYDLHNRLPGAPAARYVYSNTPTGSHMRKYIALTFHYIIKCCSADVWATEDISKVMQECPDLLLDVLRLMREGGSALPQKLGGLTKCAFHAHEDTPRFCPFLSTAQ